MPIEFWYLCGWWRRRLWWCDEAEVNWRTLLWIRDDIFGGERFLVFLCKRETEWVSEWVKEQKVLYDTNTHTHPTDTPVRRKNNGDWELPGECNQLDCLPRLHFWYNIKKKDVNERRRHYFVPSRLRLTMTWLNACVRNNWVDMCIHRNIDFFTSYF